MTAPSGTCQDPPNTSSKPSLNQKGKSGGRHITVSHPPLLSSLSAVEPHAFSLKKQGLEIGSNNRSTRWLCDLKNVSRATSQARRRGFLQQAFTRMVLPNTSHKVGQGRPIDSPPRPSREFTWASFFRVSPQHPQRGRIHRTRTNGCNREPKFLRVLRLGVAMNSAGSIRNPPAENLIRAGTA